MITDGPFAETKEQLGGYHPVECKDLSAVSARYALLNYWVTATTVWRWRKAFGVTRWGSEGSRRLH
jgi:hypothetical protein